MRTMRRSQSTRCQLSAPRWEMTVDLHRRARDYPNRYVGIQVSTIPQEQLDVKHSKEAFNRIHQRVKGKRSELAGSYPRMSRLKCGYVAHPVQFWKGKYQNRAHRSEFRSRRVAVFSLKAERQFVAIITTRSELLDIPIIGTQFAAPLSWDDLADYSRSFTELLTSIGDRIVCERNLRKS
jgi:hypothetical protein